MSKQDPIGPKGHPSTVTARSAYQQSIPMSDDTVESPPPYTLSGLSNTTTTTTNQPTPPSPRSSTSSLTGEDVPLHGLSTRQPRPQPDPYYDDTPAGGSQDHHDDTASISTQEDDVVMEEYTSPKAMQFTNDKYAKYEEEVGCFASESGGVCCSDHAGCFCSSYGGVCCSDHGGMWCSSYGGVCCSEGYAYKKKIKTHRRAERRQPDIKMSDHVAGDESESD